MVVGSVAGLCGASAARFVLAALGHKIELARVGKSIVGAALAPTLCARLPLSLALAALPVSRGRARQLSAGQQIAIIHGRPLKSVAR